MTEEPKDTQVFDAIMTAADEDLPIDLRMKAMMELIMYLLGRTDALAAQNRPPTWP
jgi:hypothetical protein